MEAGDAPYEWMRGMRRGFEGSIRSSAITYRLQLSGKSIHTSIFLSHGQSDNTQRVLTFSHRLSA